MTIPRGLLGKAYKEIFAGIGCVLAWAVSSYFFGWIGFWVAALILLALVINRVTDSEIG
jgi:hypothetical protein